MRDGFRSAGTPAVLRVKDCVLAQLIVALRRMIELEGFDVRERTRRAGRPVGEHVAPVRCEQRRISRPGNVKNVGFTLVS
jgi:hypothetical protein